MAKVIWKKNKVLSIRINENIYVLAQMLVSPYILVFEKYSQNNEWDLINLKSVPVLCCKAVTRQFLTSSEIFTQKHISPLEHPETPCYWIKLNPGAFKTKIWEGTSNEVEVMSIGEGGGSLIKFNIYDKGFGNKETIKSKISLNDVDVIRKYETTSVEIFPSFNCRLYLCYLLKCNVDPIKELAFQLPIPESYKVFFIQQEEKH